MRRMLAGFLATSMIVAVASSVTFAATAPSFDFSPVNITTQPRIDSATGDDFDSMAAATVQVKLEVKEAVFTLNGLGTIVVPVNETYDKITATFPAVSTGNTTNFFTAGAAATSVASSEVREMLLGKKFSSVRLDDEKLYSGEIVAVPGSTSALRVQFNDATKLDITTGNLALNIVANFDTTGIDPKDDATPPASMKYTHAVTLGGNTGIAISNPVTGNGKELSEVEKSGDFFKNMTIADVIVCDGDGRPVPMTEKNYGVDKDLNTESGVQSGKTLYFMINDNKEATFADDTYWKLKITKGDNGKLIKKIDDVTKIFSGGMYDAYYGNKISGIDFSKRHRFIKVEMNEIYTDDEYKITLDARISPTSKAESKFTNIDDSEIKIKDFYFYMKNIVKNADSDWRVGIGGLMLNPLSNDWNEVTYYDEDGDVAFMKFFADSDVSKFYAKLSTKWEHADYASYFNDQDAYIYDFTGSPKISSTSRCDLQIYNPFVDDDGNTTIDPETATVYQVIDGDLFDVTDNFTYQEGDNGDMAFCTRTRFLGTYIICEKPVEEAVDGDAPDTDLVPEDTTPVEVTPGNDDGGKAPANTGKYL